VAYLSVPHTGLPRRRRAEGGVAAGGWLLVDGGIQAGGSLALLLDLLAASADSLLSRYLARNSSYNCAYLDSIYRYSDCCRIQACLLWAFRPGATGTAQLGSVQRAVKKRAQWRTTRRGRSSTRERQWPPPCAKWAYARTRLGAAARRSWCASATRAWGVACRPSPPSAWATRRSSRTPRSHFTARPSAPALRLPLSSAPSRPPRPSGRSRHLAPPGV
jgi:hypothetical protein